MRLNKNHPLYKADIKTVLSISGIDFLQGKSFLITGATGLIGVHLIDALMQLGGVSVYAVGRNRQKAIDRLGEYFDNPLFHFIEQDVCEPFSASLNVDYIIPLASNTHPLAYSKYPIETIRTNVRGAENALELAYSCGATVLYPSTVEVYGNAFDQHPMPEGFTGSLNLSTSRSCYTESKRVCEAMCQSYIAEHGIRILIVRLSRVFGPTMLESDSKASSQFIKKALAGEDVVLKSNGEQSYSYTYVSDAVAAILHVLINGENGVAYNISNENCDVKLKEFAQICAEITGKTVVYDLPSEDEAKGYSIATNAILDNTRLKALGFTPRYDLEDAIQRTVEILR